MSNRRMWRDRRNNRKIKFSRPPRASLPVIIERIALFVLLLVFCVLCWWVVLGSIDLLCADKLGRTCVGVI